VAGAMREPALVAPVAGVRVATHHSGCHGGGLSDDALESVLTRLRETKARRVQVDSRGRLQLEMPDDATRLDRIEASIAAIEQPGATEALDYARRQHALSDVGVRVAVYPSRHAPPYRRAMGAFEERDGRRRLWVDGPLRIDCEALRALFI
jgi:hypothetical protein